MNDVTTIEITESARNLIIQSSKANKKEVCGILVGLKPDESKFIATHALEDNQTCKRSFFHIIRKTKNVYPKLIQVINQYKEIDYIGEWHSHPGGIKKKSKIDHNTMVEMVRNPKFGNIESLILLISVKIDEMNFQLIGYIYESNQCRKARIVEIEDALINKYLN